MEDPGKEFPNVRVLGTIGWIAAGWMVGLMEIETTALPLEIAAGVSVLTGLYCFFLPHTPPHSAGQKITISDVLGLKALSLMKERSFGAGGVSGRTIPPFGCRRPLDDCRDDYRLAWVALMPQAFGGGPFHRSVLAGFWVWDCEGLL